MIYFPSSFLIDRYQRENALQDPGWIVIDEVLGMLITWTFAPKHTWMHLLACFVLFRVFDILKPWPIKWFDKNMKDGYGVMTDDLIAAYCYSGPLYFCLDYFLLSAK